MIAGGRASRFGSDKALARWHGATLLDRARAALAPLCADVVVCGGARPGIAALPDLPRAGLGPLGGVAAALVHARGHGFASVLTIGCDMPAVPAPLLAALAAGAPAWCPDAPVLAHWPVGIADALLAELAGAGDRGPSLRRWATRIGARAVPAPGALANVNTPADLPA